MQYAGILPYHGPGLSRETVFLAAEVKPRSHAAMFHKSLGYRNIADGIIELMSTAFQFFSHTVQQMYMPGMPNVDKNVSHLVLYF